jgi:hemerythrin superfamily protein
MDLWQAIRDDHEAVENLFEKIEDAEDGDERARLITALINALEAHAQGEEKAVDPELAKIEALLDALADGVEKHDAIRELLDQIVKADNEEQLDLLAELEETVQDHFEEEEEDVLAVAEQEIDDDTAKEMLRRFEAVKKAAVRL